MFHPNLGRFLQVDPTGFDGGDVNLYRPEGNDPANVRDPTGLQPVTPKTPGGSDHEFNTGLRPGTELGRFFSRPDSKAESLEGVPFWRKPDLLPLPKDLKRKTCGRDQGWSGNLPAGWVIGPDG